MNTVSPLHVNAKKAYEPSELAHKLLMGREFDDLYGEITSLISDTSEYLDTDGRAAAARMCPEDVSLYNRVGMQISTSLMRTGAIGVSLRGVKFGNRDLEGVINDIMTFDVMESSLTELPSGDVLPRDLIELHIRARLVEIKVSRFSRHLAQETSIAPAANNVHQMTKDILAAFSRQ